MRRRRSDVAITAESFAGRLAPRVQTSPRMKIVTLSSCLALAAVGAGCADLDAEDVGSEEQSLSAPYWRGGAEPPGLVQVRTGTLARDMHTGLVVSRDATSGFDLILTSERWATSGMNAAGVTIVDDPSVGGGVSRPGRHVNDSVYFPGAVVQTAHFTDSLATLDTRASSVVVGRVLECFEYSYSTDLRHLFVRVDGYDGDSLTATYSQMQEYLPQSMDSGDAGAMCRDAITEVWVGFVTQATSTNVTLRRIAGLSTWLSQMQHLTRVRTRSNSARVALYNNLGSPMCADIPWGSPYAHEAVNQYACHYAQNQRFWLDYSIDSSSPRLVSDASGLCLDMPSSSTSSSTNFQQYPCNAGTNQRFEMTFWGDSSGGWKLRPRSGAAANQCLSVEGGSSPDPSPLEQRTCNGVWDQRWYLRFL